MNDNKSSKEKLNIEHKSIVPDPFWWWVKTREFYEYVKNNVIKLISKK